MKKTNIIGLRLSEDESKALKQFCKEDKVGISFFLRSLLADTIKKRERQTKLKL